MQTIIAAAFVAIAFGAPITCLIAEIIPLDMLQRAGQNGRYGRLTEPDQHHDLDLVERPTSHTRRRLRFNMHRRRNR